MLPSVSLQLHSMQYQAALALAAGFAAHRLRQRWDHLRPRQRLITSSLGASISASSMGNTAVANNTKLLRPPDPIRSRIARAWWRYAILGAPYPLVFAYVYHDN